VCLPPTPLSPPHPCLPPPHLPTSHLPSSFACNTPPLIFLPFFCNHITPACNPHPSCHLSLPPFLPTFTHYSLHYRMDLTGWLVDGCPVPAHPQHVPTLTCLRATRLARLAAFPFLPVHAPYLPACCLLPMLPPSQ